MIGFGKSSKAASYPHAVKAFEAWKLDFDRQWHEKQSAKGAYEKVVQEVETWQASLIANFVDDRTTREVYRKLGELKQTAIKEAEAHSSEVGDDARRLAIELGEYLRVKAEKLREVYDDDLWRRSDAESIELLTGVTPSKVPAGPAPWEATFKPEVNDLDQLAAAYNAARAADVDAGELSESSVKSISAGIDHFLHFSSGDLPLTELNSALLNAHRDHCRAEVSEGRMAASTAKLRMTHVKGMLKWAYQNEHLDSLPRALETFTIKAGAKAVEIVNDAEIRNFLAESDGRLRLYCLLSLNTGMTQQDMSDLKPSDVDWDGQYLTRKRTKTSKHENAPTVTYKLWPETVELLRELGDTEGDRLIRKPAGQPLVVGRSDGTRHPFSVLNKTLGLQVTPKALRKASATKLASHEVYGRFGQYFLGHAPSNIADAHYIKPSLVKRR